MKKLIFNLIVITSILVALLCVSCSKTTTEVVVEPSWKLVVKLYATDKIILNCYKTTDNSRLYISTLFNFFRLESNEEEPTKVYDNQYGFEPLSMNYKPAISDSITAYSNENLTAIILKLNEDPVSKSYGYEYIDIKDIDSIYSSEAHIELLWNFRTPIGALNEQKQFLTVILDTDGTFFCLVNYDFDDSSSGIRIDSIQNYNFYPGYLCMNDIKSFNNRFFVATNCTAPYLVYSTGDYHEMDVPSCLEFFSYQDTLYAFTTSYFLYYSNDLGENWEEYAHFTGRISFFEVSGKLCCHRDDDIHEIDFVSGEVKELDNWGLEGNEITSINEFNGKVYISTLSGLFYRELDEFFTYKEEDDGKENLIFEKI